MSAPLYWAPGTNLFATKPAGVAAVEEEAARVNTVVQQQQTTTPAYTTGTRGATRTGREAAAATPTVSSSRSTSDPASPRAGGSRTSQDVPRVNTNLSLPVSTDYTVAQRSATPSSSREAAAVDELRTVLNLVGDLLPGTRTPDAFVPRDPANPRAASAPERTSRQVIPSAADQERIATTPAGVPGVDYTVVDRRYSSAESPRDPDYRVVPAAELTGEAPARDWWNRSEGFTPLSPGEEIPDSGYSWRSIYEQAQTQTETTDQGGGYVWQPAAGETEREIRTVLAPKGAGQQPPEAGPLSLVDAIAEYLGVPPIVIWGGIGYVGYRALKGKRR